MSSNQAPRAFAAKLRWNALAGICLVVAPFVSLPIFANFGESLGVTPWIIFMTAASAALALSLYLLFDAMLFNLMASYEDDAEGGLAVDDFLARTGLRKMPSANRPLAERMAGSERLLTFQRAALLVFVAFFAFMTVRGSA